ncbi:uncharacterized protein LOC119737669 isoform X3 [Patiria miniata]|uniref:Ferric-chelate reductase 1 n=1 Tax=Patiria miniata TaxID=46514 RepID=A0A914AX41_PATMI|nr:uncharacterized protein LOC119737669 isoform X3 [Patiria miniata]
MLSLIARCVLHQLQRTTLTRGAGEWVTVAGSGSAPTILAWIAALWCDYNSSRMDSRRAVCAVFVLYLAASLQLTSCQDLTGCGGSKGCYRHPSDCTGDNCIAFVTWENVGDGRTRFSMRASQTENLAWVAVGLRPESVPAGMVPADVYVCTKDGTGVERSENILTDAGRWNSVARYIPDNSVTTELLSYADNVISCVFTRIASIATGDATFYDISGDNAYYLLLAVGNGINADGTINSTYHAARRETPIALKLQSDFVVPPEPELLGCGTTRGCFRQPPTCEGDDCTAFLTWENTADGQTQFALRASLNGSLSWVAFGLRPAATTEGMSPADVYACTRNSEVKRSENVSPYDSAARVIPANTVTPSLAVYYTIPNFVTVIECVFTRKASLAGDATFYDISGDNAYYLLMAIGLDINADGTIAGKIHSQRWPAANALKLQSEFALPTPPPATPKPGGDLVGCGETKGCFSQPTGCSGSNCQAYVTWQGLQDGQVRFVMMGQAQGWVAFGLRRSNINNGMSPADVYACTSDREVKRSENVSPLNSEARVIPADTLTLETIQFENNAITCTFTRQPFLQGDDTFYNISGDNAYYVLMAIGASINADGTIGGNRHTDRWSTTETQKLTEFGAATGEPDPVGLAKAHASLMMIAWIGFASIGITLARFFKPLWPDSKLLGQKVWFTIHRACMVSCLLCFCAAFILIFVYKRGFVDTGNAVTVAHAICGIIVTCLGIANPIMAIFRPHPGTPKRPIFNWAHWSVGTLAHLLGLVTVFLGIGYQTSLLSGLASYSFFIMLAFVIFHVVMWVLFEVMGRMAESKVAVKPALPQQPDTDPNPDEPGRSNDMPLKTAGGDSNQQLANTDTEPPAGAAAKMILLCIYVVGVVAFLICLVVFVGLA